MFAVSITKKFLPSTYKMFIRQISPSPARKIPMSSFSPGGPIHWILDWDGTITRHDTLNALVNIAAKSKPNTLVSEDWTRVSESYISDYKSALETLAPLGKLPTTMEDEKKLLKALEEVEQKSIDRVSESKIFEHLTREQIDQGAKQAIESREVELREGYLEMMQHIQSRMNHEEKIDDKFNILSVNWSRQFISKCLKASKVNVDTDSIYANELGGIDDGRPASGQICPEGDKKIISSSDKLEVLHKLKKTNSHSKETVPVVYVGDSWTDFEALLAADLGVCIRDTPITSSQKKLAEAFERLGIKCPHIRDRRPTDDESVVWATNFVELQEWASTMSG